MSNILKHLLLDQAAMNLIEKSASASACGFMWASGMSVPDLIPHLGEMAPLAA